MNLTMEEQEFDEMMAHAVQFFIENFPSEAESIREGVREGKAVEISRKLSAEHENSVGDKDKLFSLGIKRWYLMKCCIRHNDGIPLIEIIRDWIDTGSEKKKLNADDSAENFIKSALMHGVNIEVFKKYILKQKRKEKLVRKVSPSLEALEQIIEYIELYDMPDTERTEVELISDTVKEENLSKNQIANPIVEDTVSVSEVDEVEGIDELKEVRSKINTLFEAKFKGTTVRNYRGFSTEKDYNAFASIFSKFLLNKSYEIPSRGELKTISSSDTKILHMIGSLAKSYNRFKKKKYKSELFNLVRIIDCFSSCDDDYLDRMTRNGSKLTD